MYQSAAESRIPGKHTSILDMDHNVRKDVRNLSETPSTETT